MEETWKDTWRSAFATLGVFGLVFFSLVIAGLYLRLELSAWVWILILGGSVAAAGFWRAWKRSSLLGTLLGNVLATVLLLTGLIALPDPVVKISPGEILARFLYIPVFSALLAALGHLLARLIRGRQQRGSVPQVPRQG